MCVDHILRRNEERVRTAFAKIDGDVEPSKPARAAACWYPPMGIKGVSRNGTLRKPFSWKIQR